MNQAVYVNLSVKTVITFLWNVLYMIILEEFICNSKKLWRDRFEYQFIWEYRTFNIS
jgi:hypothetical protein